MCVCPGVEWTLHELKKSAKREANGPVWFGVVLLARKKWEIGVFTLAEEANCVFTLLFVTL